MKQLFIKIGILIALLLAPSHTYAYDFEVNGIFYDVIDPASFTCGVSGIIDKDFTGNVIIPEHISYAGKDLTVTEILEDAFSEASIESISFPSTCISIGRYAFWRCSKLLTMDIPQGVTKIGSSAFKFCSSLREISLPPSLTEIGEYAFSDCESLESVNISDLKAWCTISFEAGWCHILSDTYTSNPLSNMKAKLFLNGELISRLFLDESITEINSGAFVGYAYLTGVDLNDNIQSIGRYSFWNCANLKKLRIGKGLTEIPYQAFAKCPNLAELYIVDNDASLMFDGGISGDRYNPIATGFRAGDFRESNLKEIYIGRDLVQPKTTNAIKGYYAIFDQQDVDSVTIGPNVTLITKSYFNGDYVSGSGLLGSIKNILKLTILPSTSPLYCMFEDIDYGEISGSPLKLVNLNTFIMGRDFAAKYKYDYVNFHRVNTYFDQCTNLDYFEIGQNVTDISYLNLDKNDNISNITVKSSIPPTCEAQEFTKSTYLHSLLKVPNECMNLYKSAPVWKNFWNIEGCDFPSSGIKNVEYTSSSMFIISEYGSIRVINKDEGNTVRVFSIHGTKIAETRDAEIHNLPNGVYIVTVGDKSFKVFVR